MIRNSCILLVCILLIPGSLSSQEPDTTAPKTTVPSEDIFSGTVTRLTDRSVTIVRRVPGQPPVTREFTRDAGTTVEGKLRSKARVTVRYKALDDGGFVAVHIIVR